MQLGRENRGQSDISHLLLRKPTLTPVLLEPYGLQLAPAPADGPGYTGHVYDAATGLNYMQQRYYDPGIGRFLSIDPVSATSVGGNFNRYWYADNNPYRFYDPDGRRPDDPNDRPPENCNEGMCPNPDERPESQPVLPDNPSGLGDGWEDVTPQGGQNPKIPKRYRGPKGTEIEFDPADPNKPTNTWGGKNHWHDVNPDTGKRQGGHLPPGSAIPGADGDPARNSMMDRMRSITPGPIVKLGTAAVIIYIVVSEGSRVIPARNLVPVP